MGVQFENVSGLDQTAPSLMVGSLVASAGGEYMFGYDTTLGGLLWLDRWGVQYSPMNDVWREAEQYLTAFFKKTGVTLPVAPSPLNIEAVVAGAKGQSLKVLPMYKDGRQRNTRVLKMIGLANTTGPVALYSGDHTRTAALLESLGTHQGAKGLNEEIQRQRATDPRAFVVIVEGPANFMATYKRQLTEPDFIVFVGTTEALRQLEVPIADEGFGPDDQPMTLDDLLFKSTRKKRTVKATPVVTAEAPVSKTRAKRATKATGGVRPKTVTRHEGVPDVMGMPPALDEIAPDDERVVGTMDLGNITADDDDIASRAANWLDGAVNMEE